MHETNVPDRAGQHAQRPGVGLAQVPEAEEPECRGEVLHLRAGFGASPMEIRLPQGDPDITPARYDAAQLLLEGFRDPQGSGHYSGGNRAEPVQRVICGLDDGAGPAAPCEVERRRPRRGLGVADHQRRTIIGELFDNRAPKTHDDLGWRHA